MAEKYVIDVFVDTPRTWMLEYPFKQISGKYGIYYSAAVTNEQRIKISRNAHKRGIKYRYYEEKWNRSNSYRIDFFKHNQPPYRCRYCHRPLTKETLVVDHLIPVAKTKKSGFARNLLYIKGINNVNSWRNLVPSCSYCNSRKGTKMGLWYIRGILGCYESYWVLLRLTEAVATIAIVALIAFQIINYF